MGQVVKMGAVVGGVVLASSYIDGFVKSKGYIKADASYAKFTPAAIGAVLGIVAHKAGLL